MARVLDSGGALCVTVTHPTMDAGRWDGDGFVIDEPYLEPGRFEGTFARDGLEMTFRGWRYPLEAHALALEAAGLVIEALREPLPALSAPAPFDHHRLLPLFLMLRARRPA